MSLSNKQEDENNTKKVDAQEALSSDNFIEFLKQNSSIFYNRPELLELVTLPDERGASSLLERQVSVLKNKLQQMEVSHKNLVNVVRTNEQISDRFVKISNMLLSYKSLDQFAVKLPKALMETFSIDEVCFKTEKAILNNPHAKAVYQQSLKRMKNQHTVCDNRFPSSIISLFFKKPVKSAALIPLKTLDSNTAKGILALGSFNDEKYTPELGTIHLDRLGLMAGVCLQRLQS